MKKKREKIISSIFVIVGVVIIIVGIITLIDGMKFKERAVEVTGKIVDIETYYESKGTEKERRYHVYVDYTYNGIEYKDMLLNDYDAGMSIGENITLLCDPDNPTHIRTETGTVSFPIIFFLIGAIVSIVGIYQLVSGAKESDRQKRLLTEGRVLQAVVESVSLNTKHKVNGRSPYIIHCVYTDEYNGTIYRFRSDNIWDGPELMFQSGSNINVYVDPKDFSNYYVDVENSISTNHRVVDFS